MGKIVLELVEQTFSKKASLTYELSILIGMDSLCYLIADKDRQIQVLKRYNFTQSLHAGVEWADAIQKVLNLEPDLQLSYQRTRIGIRHPFLALIPSRLYNETQNRIYLEALFQLHPSDRIFADEIRVEPLRLVYALDQSVLDVLRNRFPAAEHFHAASGLLVSLKKVAEAYRGHRLFLNVQKDNFQAFLFDRGRFIFYNSFQFEASKDFIYFVLLILDQHQLTQDSVQVFIAGTILEDSELFQLLSRYLHYLKRVPVLGLYEFGAELEQAQLKYRFMDLFSLLYCSK